MISTLNAHDNCTRGGTVIRQKLLDLYTKLQHTCIYLDFSKYLSLSRLFEPKILKLKLVIISCALSLVI